MITLRPYQNEALEALHDHICKKDTNPCVVIPTGGGKSLLIGKSILDWKCEYAPFRCLVLAHRKELVAQNHDEFVMFCEQEGRADITRDVGVYCAALKRKDYGAAILFASIDSICKRAGEFIPFDVIHVDEAHRIPPGGNGRYLSFIRECKKFNPNLKVIGWTATPFRMNVGPVCHRDHMLNEICYEASVIDLIAEGYLCGLRTKVGEAQPDTDGVKKRANEYTTASLSERTNKTGVVATAVREIAGILAREERKSVVFFCVDIEHCNMVSAELRKHGIQAPAVTNKTPAQERDLIGRAFKSGKLHAVCNVNVYTEGFNAKRIDCIVLLRPTLSPGLFAQMVGRGLRLHEAKRDCLVLDFARSIEEHGPIDLLGTGRKVTLVTCLECREVFSRAIRVCPNCGWRVPKQELERLEAVERERRMHEDKASDKSILSNIPETHTVDDVLISRHDKPGKPSSLLVRYRCGLKFYREWVCLEHPGYAGKKAAAWWATRFPGTEIPTVNGALENLFTIPTLRAWTKTVTVKKNGKYMEVIGYNKSTGGEK